MSDQIQWLREEIDRRRAEVGRLEAALDTIQAVLSHSVLSASQDQSDQAGPTSKLAVNEQGFDLSGASIREAAHAIISESNNPLHPRKVAELALKRGYRGRNADAPIAITVKHFSDMMRLDPNLTKNDEGLFSLAKRPRMSGIRSKATYAQDRGLLASLDFPSHRNRAAAIEMILDNHGRPMTTKEILERLRVNGHPVPSDERSAFNSVYGTLKNNPERFVKSESGLWELNCSEST